MIYGTVRCGNLPKETFLASFCPGRSGTSSKVETERRREEEEDPPPALPVDTSTRDSPPGGATAGEDPGIRGDTTATPTKQVGR